MSKALRLMSISPRTLWKRDAPWALHSHRKAGWVSKLACNVSLLLCSGSQPATLSFFFSQTASLPELHCFLCLSLLLFSKVRIKPTPTLRVGGRTSHQWHITFLSFYRPNFHAFCKTIHFQAVRESALCFLVWGGGGVMLVLIQGFIF